MKILLFLVALSLLLSSLSPLESVATILKNNGYASSGGVFEAVGDVDYHSEEENRVIYGNYRDFDSTLLYSLIHDESKVCIFYDLDLSDNVNNSYEITRNNAVVYYYKNNIPYVNSYRSNSTEEQDLICDIENYVNEILLTIDEQSTSATFLQRSPYTTEKEAFEPLYSGSFREEEKPYGYIDCSYVVKKYRTNDISSLYLIEANVSFTPGKTAKDSGNTSYGNWYNSTGYLKIKATRAESEVGNDQVLYGGTPVFKDAYPINHPEPPITGSSYRNGQYLKPALSTQKDPMDVEKYTWLYTYAYPESEAYLLNVGYMFEMNNSGYDLREGDVALEFEYKMTVDNTRWLFNKIHAFNGRTFHNYY